MRVLGERFSHKFEMLKSNHVKIKSMKLDITAIISKSKAGNKGFEFISIQLLMKPGEW